MKITDLEHLSMAYQASSVEGAAYAYSSSSSVASAGFAGSRTEAIAAGNSSTFTITDIKQWVISAPRFSFSSSSTRSYSYARD